MVQGVVVQISPHTRRPCRFGSTFAALFASAKRTQMDGLEWFSYSTSASASAVRSWMHQLTGFSPLYTYPKSRKSTNAPAITASYSALMVRYGSCQRPNTPKRIKSRRCRSTYFSAYLRQAARICAAVMLDFLLPNWLSTLISMGSPWQSHPGTYGESYP